MEDPNISKENSVKNAIKKTINKNFIQFSQLKVLIIESSSGLKKIMRHALMEIGFSSGNITKCESTIQAKNICKNASFDIYIVNLNLEDSDKGRELVHKLYEDQLIPCKSVMCILTSDNSRATVLSTIEKKPDEYIVKPFSTKQLKVRIYRAYQKKCDLLDIYEAIEVQDYSAIVNSCYNHLGTDSIHSLDIRIMLAEALLKLEKYDEAEIVIREALNFSDAFSYHIELGKILYYREDYEDAIKEYTTAIKSNNLLIEPYKGLFHTYMKMNDLENASDILADAIKISPQSSSLLHMQLEFALKKRDYSTVKEDFNSLLDLHKYDSQKLCQLLTGFVQAEIQYVTSSPDYHSMDKLSKHVNAVLSKNEQFIKLPREKFDYKLFKSISNSRVDIAMGDISRAKKQLYKTLSSYGENLLKQNEAMISNIVLSLWQLGDYEYAEELFNNHVNKNKIDPLISSFINTYKTDPKIDEKRTKYQDLNQKGIKFYKKEKYEMALDFFNEALKKSPSNTNATINKAQALLKLASSVSTPENKRKTYIAECKDMLFILKSMFLSPNLVKRVDAINDELTTLLQPSFSRRKIRNNEGNTVPAVGKTNKK